MPTGQSIALDEDRSAHCKAARRVVLYSNRVRKWFRSSGIWRMIRRGMSNILLEHDVTQDEVEEVLDEYFDATAVSRSSGNPITFGWTSTGRYIAVVWELVDEDTPMIYPLTAYPVPEPGSKRKRK